MAKVRRPLTPEQRAELVARFAAARKRKAKVLDLSPEEVAATLRREDWGDKNPPDSPEPEIRAAASVSGAQVDLADFERQAIAEGVLDLEDILKVRAEAKQKVELERRAEAKKKLIEQAVERERRAAGLIPEPTLRQKELEELVPYTVRLPKQGPRDVPEHRVDGRVFTNGRTYEVTRAQHLSLIATEYAAWQHHFQIMGQSRTYYDDNFGGMVYMGGYARGSGGMA